MKILVCAKQVQSVPGPAVLLKDGTGIDPHFVLRRLGEADEQALEEALRLAEPLPGGTVMAVTVGPENCTDALRKCLAMGAHAAARIWREDFPLHDPLSVARVLARHAQTEAVDLVLCGVQSADAGHQITGPATAAFLKWPCVTVATQIEVGAAEREILVHREAGGGGLEVVQAALPAVITVQTGINSPRSPSFKNTAIAKKASISVIDPGQVERELVQPAGLVVPPRATRRLTVIDGGAAEVAERIKGLLQKE